MKVEYSDNAATILNVPVQPGHTVLIVASASAFPVLKSGNWMYVSVEDEVIKVTDTSGNVLTCDPVQQDHPVGSSVEIRVSSDLLNDLPLVDLYTLAGQRPADGSLKPGEVFVNIKDKQAGFGDEHGNAVEMQAVRYHSAQALYKEGDHVIFDGALYRAKSDHSGAFNKNNWESAGGGGGMDWVLSSSNNVVAVPGQGYLMYCANNPRTADLPIGVAGASVGFNDIEGASGLNNIVITPNGSERIMGLNEPFEMDTDGMTVIFTYADNVRGWVITGGSW